MLLLLLAAAAPPCREAPDARIWFSPAVPVAGQPLRLIVVSPSSGDITADGTPLPTIHRGYSHGADLTAPTAGSHRIEFSGVSCKTVVVQRRATPPVRSRNGPAWPTTAAWDRATEDFYAAWIEALFDAPPDESLSFPSLAPVIRDPKRNFLWGHLGLREDDPKNRAIASAEPDCADLPYYLRGYFSWKMGLPFAFRDCDRGATTRPPRCGTPLDNQQPVEAADPLSAFRKLLRVLANKVHSGSARTALDDEATDYYPVPLAREHLRPGVVYADPYGHILMIVKWQDQTPTAGGRLFAVDGQPDNSVARKRFWEGTFLFAQVAGAGPGFKSFRPVVQGTPLAGEALARDRRFAPFSPEQAKLSPDDFYARMARLINPQGLDAVAAYDETLAALVEQLETRIGSVDNGETYMREHRDAVIAMPEGAKIFETVGPWEDYATPSRDMRLLIAMNVLLALPDRVARHPELFRLGGRAAAEVRTELVALHDRRIRERAIEYRRTDGTPYRLTVADLLARRAAFEQAYNPNDCIEVRWGATPGTPDHATCRRHAPDDQRARMTAYRPWFHETRRPPR